MPKKPTQFYKNQPLTVDALDSLVDGVNHINTIIEKTVLFRGMAEHVLRNIPNELKFEGGNGMATVFVTAMGKYDNEECFFMYTVPLPCYEEGASGFDILETQSNYNSMYIGTISKKLNNDNQLINPILTVLSYVKNQFEFQVSEGCKIIEIKALPNRGCKLSED